MRIAVGFPRSCIIRLARRAFKRGKPWKRVACTSYAPHAPLHTRSIPSRIPLPRLRFSLSFYWPSPRSSSLECSVCTRQRLSMLDVFHVVWETTIRIDGLRFLDEIANRAKISGKKDEKFWILTEDTFEEKLKFDEVRRFISLPSRFFGLGMKKSRVVCKWSGKVGGEEFYETYRDLIFHLLNFYAIKFHVIEGLMVLKAFCNGKLRTTLIYSPSWLYCFIKFYISGRFRGNCRILRAKVLYIWTSFPH